MESSHPLSHSEGGYSDDGCWRHVKYFDYNYLRNAFRTALLNEMEDKIGPSFKKVKAKCYRQHEHGFYVYAKPNLCDPKVVAKYIGRYLGRPVIATSRIDGMMEILLLSTITAMKTISMWKRPCLLWISSNVSSDTSRKDILK